MPKTASVAAKQTHHARVDAQIADAPEFARPILQHLRSMVHAAVPEVTEEIKWGRPFFVLNGENLCFMAAFKQYCAFGFWSPRMPEYLQAQGMPTVEGAGSVGRIATLADLPKDLPKYVAHAAEFIRTGSAGSAMEGRTRKGTRQDIAMPGEFATALQKSLRGKMFFDSLPPSARREFVEWIASAKKEETQARRVAEAIHLLEAERRFNDRYRSK